ncbi:MAG: ABC transporter substrate-binding protein [Candidatus Dormibacteraceae bacterium]
MRRWQHGERMGVGGRSLRMAALLSLFGVLLAACGSSPASSSGGQGSGPPHGTLTMSVQNFGAPILKPVVDAFQKKYPKVHIDEAVVTGSGTTYQTTLLTEKLAGNLPDIVNPQDVLSPTLSTDGITADLTPYLKKGQPYHQDYWLPNIMASYIPTTGKDKGKVFALPNEADAVVVYYNKNEFKAAGVPFPADNWTWSQMIADAARLKKVQGGVQTQWGLCDTPDWQAMYNPLMKAFGVTSLSETKADLASSGSIKTWKMLVEPTTNGDAVPYSTYLANSANCSTLFDSGQAAMYFGVRGNLPTVRPAAAGKFDFDVAPMPFVQGVHGQTRPTGAGSIAWAMSTQAKNVPLTMAFFKFLFSPEGQKLEEAGYGVVPAIPSALKSGAAWQKLPGPPDNVQAFTIAAKSGTIAPQTPKTVYSLTQTDIPKAIEGVVDNHESYAQAFGQLNTAINAAYSG